jgi:ABC-2 type transport system permease protein
MRALPATERGAMAEAWANRRGFWTQILVMVVNDVVWVVFWVLFFHRVGTLRGWDSHRVLLLLAVLTTSAGFVLGVFGNARRIGRLAADGELDAALALPVPPLAYLLVRRIDTTNLGDLLFGVVLFAVAAHPTPERTAIYLAGSLVAIVLLTGFLIAIGSTAFFIGRSEAGELGFQAMLMFATYPVDVFTGPARALLYTVIPAAFIGAVPARLMSAWDPRVALAAVGMAAVFAAGARVLFNAGLRRYTSGAVWTRA